MISNTRYKGSIKKRLVWIILLATSLSGLLGYSGFLYYYVGNQYNKNLDLAQTVGHVLGQNLAKIILLNDISIAADITSSLKSFHSIKSMVLYKKDGKAIYEYSKDGKSFATIALPDKAHRKSFQVGNVLRLYTDASYQGTKLGYLQLKIKVKSIVDITQENFATLSFIYLLMILFSYFLALMFADKFTKPILELIPFLEKVNFTDRLKKRITIKEHNEYGKLYEEINIMLDRIESNYDAQKIATVAFETQSGMFITNKKLEILKVNKAFSEITGYLPQEVIGKISSIFKSNTNSKEFHKKIRKNLYKYGYWSGELKNRHKEGDIHSENVTIQAVLSDESEVMYYVFSFVDLSLQKEFEKKLEYMKRYDILTGLQNRNSTLSDIQENLNNLKNDSWGALFRFDIKDFKIINDAYGRSIGDLLLMQIAKRLKDSFPDAKLFARLATDDFLVYFSSLSNQKYNASIESKIIAKKLIKTLERKFRIDEKQINIITHVGIALYNKKVKIATELLKHADMALSLAKKEDRQIAFFDKQAESIAKTHVNTYTQLLTAIDQEQFELVYQLQYNRNEEIYAVESLIRWNHPTKGLISPSDFIPIAEKTGLILPLGLWVIKAACKQLAIWSKNPKTADWVLAINVSAKQFREDNFVQSIKEEIDRNGVNYKRVKIELTESVLVNDIDRIIHKMQELKDLGIQISLDDFGTGYASLGYLKNLPIDQMKIDLSFVLNMLQDKRDVAIIKGILLLGKALNLEVIAEGVETKEHYEYLKKLGCNFYQGYYFARPQKIENINKLIGI